MYAMRIGVRAHDLGRDSAELLADKVGARGLKCVQLTLHEAIEGMDGAAGRLNPGLAYEIGAAFHERDVQIAVLSCYINPIHPDEGERARQIELFKEHLRFVRDFGCGIVATETGSLNTDFSFHPGNHTEESFWRMLKSVGAMVEEAERFGAFVGVEGVANFVASDPKKIERMLKEIGSNNLQIVFDAVNLLSMENYRERDRIVQDSFDLFGDRIAVVHAKDFRAEDGRLKSVPLGQGLMNYTLLLGLLKRRKPSINIIIEDTSPDTIDASMRHLRDTWQSV